MDTSRQPADQGDPAEPVSRQTDYRYLLANERTFLAYLRTALALQVAGLGVLQFLTHGHDAVRYVLGIALVTAGSFVGLSSQLQLRRNERAMRAGQDIRPSRSGIVVVVVVVVVPLVAAVAMALG
jgi:putative membrane protein